MTSAETVATDLHQEDPAGRVAALFNLLDVREVGERRFTGLRKHGGVGRVYGGQVVAQALAAASQTVEPDRLVHSLHAYFLRGGSEDHEIEFQVEADFDGGSFSNRRVIALQQGKVIFNLAASFHVTEPGHHHQDHMPDVAEPDDLPSVKQFISRASPEELAEIPKFFYSRPMPFELRLVGPPPMLEPGPMDSSTAFWFRVVAEVDREQWMHRAIISYVSDFGVLGAAVRPHGGHMKLQMASLDHSLWFHGDARADDWLLFTMNSPWSGGGRGLGFGRIFDRDGRLVASVAQEGLMRDRSLRTET